MLWSMRLARAHMHAPARQACMTVYTHSHPQITHHIEQQYRTTISNTYMTEMSLSKRTHVTLSPDLPQNKTKKKEKQRERWRERRKDIIEKSRVESYKQLVGHDTHASTPELILNCHDMGTAVAATVGDGLVSAACRCGLRWAWRTLHGAMVIA